MQRISRRQFITGIGTISTAVISAGCTGGSNNGNSGSEDSTAGNDTTTTSEAMTTSHGGGGANVVAAGPNGKLVFEPEQIQVSVGNAVTWEFESPGHNVSARPQDHEKITIPDSAESFASYENGKTYAVVDEGSTYEYTFETPGEYTYVCIPHTSSGMVGTVTVSE